MGPVTYESKSTGQWLYGIAGVIGTVGLVLTIMMGVQLRPEAFVGLLIIAFAFFIANFATLTVRVSEQEIHWFFGGGFIGRRLPLERVTGVETRITPWYWGWGIRITPTGWLWRSHGLETVWISYDEKKQAGIGTQDPDELVRAVTLALEARSQ